MKLKGRAIYQVICTLIVSCVVFLPIHSNNSHIIQLKGLIDAPINLPKKPEFPLFFKGQETFNSKENGIFTFTLEEYLPDLSLLVCEDLSLEFENMERPLKHTVRNTLLDPKKEFKFFVRDKVANKTVGWREAELKPTISDIQTREPRIVIPQNCILCLMNPKLVEKIETMPFDTNSMFEPGPKIILSNKNGDKIINDSLKALAKSVEVAKFYSMGKFANIHRNFNVKISAPIG